MSFWYLLSRYEKMSDEELQELAKEKVKNTGSFKRSAIRAQQELYDRHHWAGKENTYDDGITERGLEDIDYNG